MTYAAGQAEGMEHGSGALQTHRRGAIRKVCQAPKVLKQSLEGAVKAQEVGLTNFSPGYRDQKVDQDKLATCRKSWSGQASV